MEHVAHASEVGRALGRKFEERDLASDPDLYWAACQYARDYQGSFSYMLDMRSAVKRTQRLSYAQAKGVLNCLMAEVRRNDAATAEVTQLAAVGRAPLQIEDAGVYVLNGQVIRVKANKAGTHVYPNVWTEISGSRLTEDGGTAHGEWQYVEQWQERKDLMRNLAAEGRKMTLAEAQDFLIRYGQCVRCGRHLKDAKSVSKGIGPVCEKYFADGVSGAALLVA